MNDFEYYTIGAPEPGCAADTAGAARGLGAIYPAKRYGFAPHRQPATSTGFSQLRALGTR